MLKYADKPQVFYSGTHDRLGAPPRTTDDAHASKFQGTAPIRTAPTQSNTPVYILEPEGRAHLALYHRDRWQKVRVQKDSYSGATRLEMTGEAVANPVAWKPL
jgi:hypothetical protein